MPPSCSGDERPRISASRAPQRASRRLVGLFRRFRARLPVPCRSQRPQCDPKEPLDGGSGSKTLGCRQSVNAVRRELLGCDVIPDLSLLCTLGQQLSKHLADLAAAGVNVLVAVKERIELGFVVPPRCVHYGGVSLKYRLESLPGTAGPIPILGKLF